MESSFRPSKLRSLPRNFDPSLGNPVKTSVSPGCPGFQECPGPLGRRVFNRFVAKEKVCAHLSADNVGGSAGQACLVLCSKASNVSFLPILMLGQGCLRKGPFLENNLFPLEVGLRWALVNGLKWVQEWVKSAFLGAKVGQNATSPTSPPTLNQFRQIHENPLFTQFKGVEIVFRKGP